MSLCHWPIAKDPHLALCLRSHRHSGFWRSSTGTKIRQGGFPIYLKKSKAEDSSISSMRSLTSIGTLARTVSNLLKDPDLPGLQDIFTEPSHTEEKIHFKPLSLFTKKIGQQSSRPFWGVWAVCLLSSLWCGLWYRTTICCLCHSVCICVMFFDSLWSAGCYCVMPLPPPLPLCDADGDAAQQLPPVI